MGPGVIKILALSVILVSQSQHAGVKCSRSTANVLTEKTSKLGTKLVSIIQGRQSGSDVQRTIVASTHVQGGPHIEVDLLTIRSGIIAVAKCLPFMLLVRA